MPTRNELASSKCTYEAHYNMGKVGGGYGYRSIQYPRFSFIDRVYKDRRPGTRQYYMDGEEIASIEEAAEKYNTPPVLSDDELHALLSIPEEYAELESVEAAIGNYPKRKRGSGPPIESDSPQAKVMHIMWGLKVKGMIEYGPVPKGSVLDWPDGFKYTVRRRKT